MLSNKKSPRDLSQGVRWLIMIRMLRTDAAPVAEGARSWLTAVSAAEKNPDIRAYVSLVVVFRIVLRFHVIPPRQAVAAAYCTGRC